MKSFASTRWKCHVDQCGCFAHHFYDEKFRLFIMPMCWQGLEVEDHKKVKLHYGFVEGVRWC